jgi:hypothetical protein
MFNEWTCTEVVRMPTGEQASAKVWRSFALTIGTGFSLASGLVGRKSNFRVRALRHKELAWPDQRMSEARIAFVFTLLLCIPEASLIITL